MKTLLMPKEITWWIWLSTAVLLTLGLAGFTTAFLAVILLSLGNAGVFLFKERTFESYPVQVRLALVVFLGVGYVPELRWLYWLMTIGTFARVVFGYCPMARLLSLMPWNRTVPLTLKLVLRTFFTPPVATYARGLSVNDLRECLCTLEARAGAV